MRAEFFSQRLARRGFSSEAIEVKRGSFEPVVVELCQPDGAYPACGIFHNMCGHVESVVVQQYPIFGTVQAGV